MLTLCYNLVTMVRVYTWLSLVVIGALYALVASGVSSALTLFFLVGIIPGTDIVVSAYHMAGLYSALASIIIAKLLVAIIKKIQSHYKKPSRPQLPRRRRYVQITAGQ